MIHVQGIEKQFGTQTLFRDLSWHIKPGQRVGLVGPNGAGKSTLIKIIMGQETCDGGDVIISRSRSLGYLPQDVTVLAGRTVRQEVREGLSELLEMEAQIRDMEAEMASATGSELDNLMTIYGDLQAQFERDGGFQIEHRVESVLSGLGFSPRDFDRDCSELSGGWQMRTVLAKLLLQEPDILFLDEPTNHLDLESLIWLEGFLQDYPGSLVFISHDRWFLNRLSSHIAELSRRGLRVFTGNFDSYIQQASEERALLERRQKNQQRRAADLERFISRFRAKATKAKQVQSRIKALEKMEVIEFASEERSIHFRLREPPKSGRVVMTVTNGEKSYGDHTVYSRLDFELLRGRRIALVGVNGAGKSTLLKSMAGVLSLTSGRRELGFGAKLYYFAQHQLEELNPVNTVLREVADVFEDGSPTQLRSALGAFLFSDEDVDKTVAVLSGGEKARLALAKMLLTPANLLLLDEPTNHLDMSSRSVLEDALSDYSGTLVVISHDRHFLDAVCNEVWEVADGRITPFIGNYSHYLACCSSGQRPEPLPLHDHGAAKKKGVIPRTKRSDPSPKAKPEPSSQSDAPESSTDWGGAPGVRVRKSKEQRREEAQLRQGRSAEKRKLKKNVSICEDNVSRLESELETLRAVQADPAHYEDGDAVRQTAQDVARVTKELESAYSAWEMAGHAMEQFEQLEPKD